MVRYQWATDLHAATGQISMLRAIRERSFQVLSLFLISEKRATTSSMLGRFVGSSWTISAMSGCMNSRPSYLWSVEVRTLFCKKGKRDSGPAYNLLEPSFLGNTRRWETDCTGSSRPDAQVQTCRRLAAAGRVVAHRQGHKTERGRSR